MLRNMTSELLATPVGKKIKERPHRFFPSTGGDRRSSNMKHKISMGILDRRILILSRWFYIFTLNSINVWKLRGGDVQFSFYRIDHQARIRNFWPLKERKFVFRISNPPKTPLNIPEFQMFRISDPEHLCIALYFLYSFSQRNPLVLSSSH